MAAPLFTCPRGVAVAVLLAVAFYCEAIAQTQGELKESNAVQLLDLKTRLNELLTHYTEFNPEVVRLKQQIRLLEEDQGIKPSVATTNSNGPATKNVSSPSYDELTERALSQEKSPSNAPAASRLIPVVPSLISTAESAEPSAPTPVGEVKTPSQQPALTLSAAPTSASSTSNGIPAMVALLRATGAATVASAPTTNVASPTTNVASASTTNVASASTTNVASASTTNVAPASTTNVAPASSTPAASAPSEPSEIVKPANAQPKKGPVFSPLPADMTPTNQVPKRTSSSPTPEANNSMETLDEKHLLAIGDRLSFRIAEDEEDPRSLSVMDSGELEVPYLGRFYAVGKSCKDLAKALKTDLEKEYYYKATVIVAVDQKARSRGKVYLSGAVRIPGAQEIPSDETFTLSKAILCAGGFTDFADKKKVKITRKAADGVNEDHITVDVTEVLERGRTSADIVLLPGDQIYVPERLIRF